jgi:RNA polymerase sigma-70 factor (ECF subfamily)
MRERVEATGSGAGQRPGPVQQRRFEALYRANIQPLRRYVARILGSQADADEVAHDAFVRLYRSDLAQYEDLRAVLFRTGWRLALNCIRARGCNPLARADVLVPENDSLVSETETAEDRLLSREREGAYRQAIAALPPRCREVIELRTMQELSYKEIAHRLGLSVSTLEKHVVKGKKVCTEALATWHADSRQVAA